MSHLADYDIDKRYTAEVISTKRMTPKDTDEVREIILEVHDPNFKVDVDQSFGVLVHNEDEFGNEYHHRLYSVADLPSKEKGKFQMTMLVKRCFFVDEYSGEKYPGIASNYLCNRSVGDKITITGPFGLPFKIPQDKHSNIIMIGMGTGIAPFRAFIKHIYREVGDWKGQIRLFYGAKSGLELLYMNDKDGDISQYYDEETFKAFHALSPRPKWEDPIALDAALEDRAEEVMELLNHVNTYIYVAGYEQINDMLNKSFAKIMGSEEKWATRKAELKAGKKWAELIW